jgi:predicted RecB family nuclease
MAKITRDVLESYIACRYKAYLMLAGHEADTRQEQEPAAPTNSAQTPSLEQIAHLQDEIRADGHIELTSKLLSQGFPEIIGSLYQTTSSSIQFDGLQRVAGRSDIGDFHYIPILFHPNGQMQKAKKFLLHVYSFILNEIQGRSPERGVVRRTKGKSSTVPLSRNHKKGERLLNDLLAMQGTTDPPRLFLNHHCQACQFQNRCRVQAVEEDNLSLLRGFSQTEIARLNQKGIFTINQLSYTFRPRRIKKRAKNPAHPHYFALQALALREQKVFVHGSFSFEPKETRIYLDIEGVPADKSYYLIGLFVKRADGIDQKSFWANVETDQVAIFVEMLDYINQYGECSIFHYGTYEARALRSIQRRLPKAYSEMVDRILEHFVNVHSIIAPHIYFPVYSNSLKEIARYLGHSWSDSGTSGIQAVRWRQRWKETQAESIREKLIRYNMEDCIGLKIVCDAVEGIIREQPAPAHHGLPFVHTDHFEKEAGQRGKSKSRNLPWPSST